MSAKFSDAPFYHISSQMVIHTLFKIFKGTLCIFPYTIVQRLPSLLAILVSLDKDPDFPILL